MAVEPGTDVTPHERTGHVSHGSFSSGQEQHNDYRNLAARVTVATTTRLRCHTMTLHEPNELRRRHFTFPGAAVSCGPPQPGLVAAGDGG